MLEAVAQLWMTGDERNPLRGDVLRLGNMATSLTGAVKLSRAEGAILIAGRDSEPNRERFNRAAWGLRGLAYEGRAGAMVGAGRFGARPPVANRAGTLVARLLADRGGAQGQRAAEGA